MNRIKEITEENKTKSESRREEREKGKEEKRQWRIDKINALKEKFYAVASKRKWLVFLIGIAIVAYLVIFKGGFSFGGILEKVKGLF